MTTHYALAIHGGAGVLARDRMSVELEASYHAALRRAVEAGESILRRGGSSIDAVTEAVSALEDEPLFNAGRGAVFTAGGGQEMDAAIMDGSERRAGAVAGIFGPRNPIRVARAVMERTSHVLLIGDGALDLAREAGLAFEAPDYFFTEARRRALDETMALRARGEIDDDPARRHGTVGAVARDRDGRLAAATSTGGMTGKRPGRVGDTPIIGAGTFADDSTCAISATGDGEVFMRCCVGHEIDARMRHAGSPLADAAATVIGTELARYGGSGGVVAVCADGAIAMPFNSEGMYRGWTIEGGAAGTAIY